MLSINNSLEQLFNFNILTLTIVTFSHTCTTPVLSFTVSAGPLTPMFAYPSDPLSTPRDKKVNLVEKQRSFCKSCSQSLRNVDEREEKLRWFCCRRILSTESEQASLSMRGARVLFCFPCFLRFLSTFHKWTSFTNLLLWVPHFITLWNQLDWRENWLK